MALLTSLKRQAREAARFLGLDVRPNSLYSRSDWRLLRFLELNSVETIVDIGANRGQFALDVLDSGFSGRVVSFEALPTIHEELKRNSLKYAGRWRVAPRAALGSHEGFTEFHVTRNFQSSSILEPSQMLQNLGSHLEELESIEVPCTTLDSFFDGCSSLGTFLLKLDVQGAEARVLEGGTTALRECCGIMLELSLVSLYEHQPLAAELDRYLTERGFVLWDFDPVYRAPESGRLLQYDAIYFRS